MIIQLGGLPHDWVEGRASMCTLLVFIDDATSKFVWIEFAQSESFYAIVSFKASEVDFAIGGYNSFYQNQDFLLGLAYIAHFT